MDMRCPRCGAPAILVGHEDARAFFQCESCKRVWPVLASSQDERRSQEQLRVLIADDSDLLVRLIASWLEQDDYLTIAATSGRRALDAAVVQSPDIALLDLVMPPPDGFAVCDALVQLPSAPEIIFMTGMTDPSRLQRASELHGVPLLRKPLDEEIVVAAVRRAADRRRQRAVAAGTGRGID